MLKMRSVPIVNCLYPLPIAMIFLSNFHACVYNFVTILNFLNDRERDKQVGEYIFLLSAISGAKSDFSARPWHHLILRSRFGRVGVDQASKRLKNFSGRWIVCAEQFCEGLSGKPFLGRVFVKELGRKTLASFGMQRAREKFHR